MKIYSIILLGWFTCIGSACLAQSPSWSVNPSTYSHSMTVVGVIKLDKKETRNPDDKVGAFINGECRGVASAVYQKALDRYLVYMLVYNDGGNEKVDFKFYAATQNQTLASVDAFPFVVDSVAGGVDFPYVWSNVALNNKAEITSFTVPQQLQTAQFSDSSIYVSLSQFTDFTKVEPLFGVPEGASVWIGWTQQVSGVTSNDLSKPVKYTVLSEDGKARKEYWIKSAVVMGVEDPGTPTGFAMYPNPAEHLLHWQVPAREPVIQVQLTSATGQHFTKSSFYKDSADNSPYQFDLSDIAPSLYIIQVLNHPTIGAQRLVVGR
ncbi:MAG: T9SS type A sorting domain-containing protein [Bacteroidota bacterium]